MHGHTQTESEGMEKDIPCKYKPKESWGSDTQAKQTKTKAVIRDKIIME